MQIRKPLVSFLLIKRALLVLVIATTIAGSLGCANGYTNRIAAGMLAGAVVGAGVGYQFVHHGRNREYETQNTIITSVVFALATGGILAWHYREVELTKVEVSGRFARYRLCDPQDLDPSLAKQLQADGEPQERTYRLQIDQIGNSAISLDDNTKWVYPTFRKRYLQPERGETQMLSERYIWEILMPGKFVTRSQNPHYFVEEEEK